MLGYCVCFAETTPLFLGLQSIADDQVSCRQSFVAVTNPLWQDISVVITIITVRLKSGDDQGGKKLGYSRLVSTVSRKGRILAG